MTATTFVHTIDSSPSSRCGGRGAEDAPCENLDVQLASVSINFMFERADGGIEQRHRQVVLNLCDRCWTEVQDWQAVLDVSAIGADAGEVQF